MKPTISPQHIMKIFLPLLLLLAAPSFLNPAFSQTNTTPQQFKHAAELAKAKINNEQLHRIDSLLQSFIDQKKTNSVAADRKSTRLNSSHVKISYAVFCLKKKR